MPDYTNAATDSLREIYSRLASFLPNFLVAVIVLVIGWLVIGSIVAGIRSLMRRANIDAVGERVGLGKLGEKMKMRISLSGIIGYILKRFFLVVLMLTVADILHLTQVSNFLNQVLLYIPNVIAAAAILLVGSFVSYFLSDLTEGPLRAGGYASAGAIASIVRWSIMVFTLLAALDQLRVAQNFVQMLFAGFVAMIAIAGGLAFGLGGREHARQALDAAWRGLGRKNNP